MNMAKINESDVLYLGSGCRRYNVATTPATDKTFKTTRKSTLKHSGLSITPAPYPKTSFDQVDGTTSRRRSRQRRKPNYFEFEESVNMEPLQVNKSNCQRNYGKSKPLPNPIKEPDETVSQQRERSIIKLKAELRNEETKLVLLKKLKQSQDALNKKKVVSATNIAPSQAGPSPRTSQSGWPNLPAGASLLLKKYNIPKAGANLTKTAAPPAGATPRTVPAATIKKSVSIRPASSLPQRNRATLTKTKKVTPNEDVRAPAQKEASAQKEAPAQKEAAEKFAFRKQLEAKLLQHPAPKPSPEIPFIPKGNNKEFLFLLGLETVTDYLLTKDKTSCPVVSPFKCAQCKIDFTPTWKWDGADKDPKIICEECVKKKGKEELKSEHTKRLKMEFVKALKQKEEIEQRQRIVSNCDSHSSPTPSQTLPTEAQIASSRPSTPPLRLLTPPPPLPFSLSAEKHDQTTDPSATQLQGTSVKKDSPVAQIGPVRIYRVLKKIPNSCFKGKIAKPSTSMQAVQKNGPATGNPHSVQPVKNHQRMVRVVRRATKTPGEYAYQIIQPEAAETKEAAPEPDQKSSN